MIFLHQSIGENYVTIDIGSDPEGGKTLEKRFERVSEKSVIFLQQTIGENYVTIDRNTIFLIL